MASPDWLGLLGLMEQYDQQKKAEEWQKEHPDAPPLVVMPQTDPVSALKNKVALQNQLTPQAARELYDTSVRYDIRDLRPDESRMGAYWNPREVVPFVTLKQDPEIEISSQDPIDTADLILMHEFAHKRDYTDQPTSLHKEWHKNWPQATDKWVFDRVLGRTNLDLEGQGVEAYAHQAENGPHSMPPEVRGHYYPGLFKTGLGPEWPSKVDPPQTLPEEIMTSDNWRRDLDKYNAGKMFVGAPPLADMRVAPYMLPDGNMLYPDGHQVPWNDLMTDLMAKMEGAFRPIQGAMDKVSAQGYKLENGSSSNVNPWPNAWMQPMFSGDAVNQYYPSGVGVG